MSAWRYTGFDREGRRRSGRFDAPHRDGALALARAEGVRIVRLEAEGETLPFWRRDLFGSGGVPRAEVLAFFRDFGTLVAAELTLDRALRLARGQAGRRMAPVVDALAAAVVSGSALSDAMRAHPKVFAGDAVEVVRAGEMTGTLPRVLADLHTSMQRREAVRRSIVSALIYPSILLVMAVGIVGLVLASLVPSIAPLFDAPGAPKPLILTLVSGSKAFLSGWWPQLLAGAGLLAATAVVLWRRPGAAERRARLRLSLPVIGPLLAAIDAARMCRVLATLVAARVPLPAAVAATRLVPGNPVFREALETARRRIAEGTRLAEAMRPLAGVSPLTVQMIATGEEVNRLGEMLAHAAELNEEMVRVRLDRFFTLLTPVITGALGLFIGALIFSIMSAILSINDLAAQP